MEKLQLPIFQSHPENAAGLLMLDQAIELIKQGHLSLEGARFILPPIAWPLLPEPKQTQSAPRTWRQAIALWWRKG